MKVDAIDLFYLRVPDFYPARDPVKDLLLVRVQAGAYEGWGECEAAPLASLAAFVMPESHATCRSIIDAVRGHRLDKPADIQRIARLVDHDCSNLLQSPHAFSGLEMALWDVLGKRYEEPVYRLLGDRIAYGKQPYAVVPFGATPEQTFLDVQKTCGRGIRAIKVGWAGFGAGQMAADRAQLEAARRALGREGRLFLDAARIWGRDVTAAHAYCALLHEFDIEWLEEPFGPDATDAYMALSGTCGSMKLAAGEHLHSRAGAQRFLQDTGIGVLQFDAGRGGGISAARSMAEHAAACGVSYINHTYTSHLALAASLQACAGLPRHDLCEYPCDEMSLGWQICRDHLHIQDDGRVYLSDRPGIGVELNPAIISTYLTEVEFWVGGEKLHATPAVSTI
ncbi:MAG TPA: mandelate racemase/muconate lactonizing enzyme family protein [Dongiaceae bacterium]|nr:mandelate racemase/muconate lactonizing enzyme family protein [Dongiaceae bacterium]